MSCKSETIQFRDLISSDENVIFDWISNIELRRMIGTRGVPTLETHKKWFKAKISDVENITHIILFDNKPVGLIGTNSIDRNNSNCEIYLYIGCDLYRGRGLGYHSLTAFTDELIHEMGFHKVYARIFSYNKASICLFEKSGYVLEGCQKEQVCCNNETGEYCDLLWYGFLDSQSEKL